MPVVQLSWKTIRCWPMVITPAFRSSWCVISWPLTAVTLVLFNQEDRLDFDDSRMMSGDGWIIDGQALVGFRPIVNVSWASSMSREPFP